MKIPCLIRGGVEADIAFLMDSAMASLSQFDECRFIRNDIFRAMFRPLLANIIMRSQVLVAHDPNDEWQIFGYIVVEYREDDTTVLHFMYTKSTFRHMGVMTSLTDTAIPAFRKQATPVTFINRTKDFQQHARDLNLVYRPDYRYV